jgi:histidine triad (HIT) family protein
MEECIFCNIAKKEAPAEIVSEDERFLVFPDIHPKAETHLLLIPKKHIPTLNDVHENDKERMGSFLLYAQKVAKERNLKGYKLEIHVGKEGGQVIDHLHMHILADQKSL